MTGIPAEFFTGGAFHPQPVILIFVLLRTSLHGKTISDDSDDDNSGSLDSNLNINLNEGKSNCVVI